MLTYQVQDSWYLNPNYNIQRLQRNVSNSFWDTCRKEASFDQQRRLPSSRSDSANCRSQREKVCELILGRNFRESRPSVFRSTKSTSSFWTPIYSHSHSETTWSFVTEREGEKNAALQSSPPLWLSDSHCFLTHFNRAEIQNFSCNVPELFAIFRFLFMMVA